MPTKDTRIDAYIAKSADFAKPILKHLRKLVHAACPDVEETLKWSMPYFEHQGMLCGMAAFKNHCSFGFWKGSLIVGNNRTKEAMGQFGRLTSLADLPPDKVMLGYVQEAVRLNEAGTKHPLRSRPRKKKELEVPGYLTAALKKNKKAQQTFQNFSYSHKKEYVEWLTEAKTDQTRNRRLAATLAWLAEGKSRHWKYADC